CYPIGQEYMRIHRTYFELARSLAAGGRYVLRFDYFGCGDSAGETSAGSLDQWREDIRQAVRELCARTVASAVYLVGARVAAHLAMDVACTTGDVTGMVLWEPIVSGADYLAALRRAHDDMLRGNAVLDRYDENRQVDWFVELAGYPFSKGLHDEVAML